MPAQPVPMEVMQARSSGGKTLGGRDLEVRDVSAMAPKEPPPMPEGLGDRGEVEWHKIWTAGKWLWPDQDYAWVEQVSRAYDDIATFRERLKKDGLMIKGSRPGQMVSNPIIAEIRRAEETIRRCLSTLGFSPTDRARLKLTELQGVSEMQKVMNGGGGTQGDNACKAFEYAEGEW